MSKIEINNVYKIFGNNPNSVLPQVKEAHLPLTKSMIEAIEKHLRSIPLRWNENQHAQKCRGVGHIGLKIMFGGLFC